VPVSPSGYVSTLNNNNTLFFDDVLVNKGTGHNYGVDFTLEKYLSDGYYYKEIGDMLHISIKTVSTYIQRLYKKTGTNNKIQCINVLTRKQEERFKSQNIV
jgi:DNA-binding CsgD family transcriptional regulator